MGTPMKLAIVGGGPSAFYVASRLLQLLPLDGKHGSLLKIHMYDRLWAPYGLVRYGVAPDHPEVKNCTHKFDEAALDPRFNFFGNINVSTASSNIKHNVQFDPKSLFEHYSHVLFASGCTVPRLHPSLPLSSSNTASALSLVHWYTNHPSLPPAPPLEKLTHVSIIGHGNVSLDIARIILKSPSALAKYDVPEHVLAVLSQSQIKHVSIVGRRGPMEASFTTKELREMMKLEDVSMVPIDEAILKPPEGAKLTRQQTRLLTLLREGSKEKPGTTSKSFSIDFFRSPVGLASTPSAKLASSPAAQLSLAHTMLNPESKAVPTGQTSTLATNFVVQSLGYQAEPLQPWYEPGLGHLRNVGGRVVNENGATLRNVYASGWAATGAKGVLASTMLNAHDVAQTILGDYLNKPGEASTQENMETFVLNSEPNLHNFPDEVVNARVAAFITDYRDWKRIDEEELRRGKTARKERERIGFAEARTFIRPF